MAKSYCESLIHVYDKDFNFKVICTLQGRRKRFSSVQAMMTVRMRNGVT